MARNNEPDATMSRTIKRRRFLELGAAASLSAALTELAPPASAAVPSSRPTRGAVAPAALKPHAVIYDERFEAARRFALSVRGVPLTVYSIRGDVTQLWYSLLQPLWRRTAVPIAGLTAYAAMFCLERLAWDQQLRMVRCVAGKHAVYASSGWAMERAALIARGIRASSLASPARGAAADGVAAAHGPLHLWLIASPAQLAALGA